MHPDLTSPLYRALVIAAREAVDLARCPHSHFPVGAAMLASDGTIHRGGNFETITMSQTIHAEEAALMAANSQGVFVRAAQKGLEETDAIEALAIFAPKDPGLWPCGNCCATLAEVFKDQIIITITGPNEDDFEVMRFSALAPYTMRSKQVFTVEN